MNPLPFRSALNSSVAPPRVESDAAAVARLLRRPELIRERCREVAAFVSSGGSPHVALDRSRLPALAAQIASAWREQATLPMHSRWRDLAGGIDRNAEFDAALQGRSAVGMARARTAFSVLAVLLDIDVPADWRTTDHAAGRPARHGTEAPRQQVPDECIGGSRGTAAACFRAFLSGRFSSDPGDRCRVDAKALLRMDAKTLADVFQADGGHPLPGLDALATLLRRTGEALKSRTEVFTDEGLAGHLFDALTHRSAVHHHLQHGVQGHLHGHGHLHHVRTLPYRHRVDATQVLSRLLGAFGTLWPVGAYLDDGTPLGDVARHAHAGHGEAAADAGWVPFHRRVQWMAYALLEPLARAGVEVDGLDGLTALPDARNLAWLRMHGVIVPRDPAAPCDEQGESMVEQRALVVVLFDDLASMVSDAVGVRVPLVRLQSAVRDLVDAD